MHSSGLGKAILASSELDFIQRYIANGLQRRTANTITTADGLWQEIERIRTAGYARDEEENEAGVRRVAAPVVDHDVRVVGALSVSGPLQQFSPDAVPAMAITAKQYAHHISTLMGYQPGTQA